MGINSCRHFVYGLIHSLQKFRWEEFFPLPFTERGGGMQVFEIPKVLGSLIVKVQCKSMQFSLFGELVLFEQMWKCHQWWFSSIAFVRLRTKRYSVDYFLHLEQQHFLWKLTYKVFYTLFILLSLLWSLKHVFCLQMRNGSPH